MERKTSGWCGGIDNTIVLTLLNPVGNSSWLHAGQGTCQKFWAPYAIDGLTG